MKFSSHLYLRTDGTLGRFPIIETDGDGVILSVVECGETLVEQASVQFFAGVIVPGFIASNEIAPQDGYIHRSDLIAESDDRLSFASKEDFCKKTTALSAGRARACGLYPQRGAIAVGAQPGLLLIDNFDLNSFASQNPRIKRVI